MKKGLQVSLWLLQLVCQKLQPRMLEVDGIAIYVLQQPWLCNSEGEVGKGGGGRILPLLWRGCILLLLLWWEHVPCFCCFGRRLLAGSLTGLPTWNHKSEAITWVPEVCPAWQNWLCGPSCKTHVYAHMAVGDFQDVSKFLSYLLPCWTPH